MATPLRILLCLLATLAASGLAGAQRRAAVGEWSSYGGTNWSGLTMMVLATGRPGFTDFPYVPNGKLGPESTHPARPMQPQGPQGLPLIKPPYSRMTAYNLASGEIAWQVPTGPGPDGELARATGSLLEQRGIEMEGKP